MTPTQVAELHSQLERYSLAMMQSLLTQNPDCTPDEIAADAVTYAMSLIQEIDRGKVAFLKNRERFDRANPQEL
jgi:hypothetical protein